MMVMSPLMAIASGESWLTFRLKDNSEISVASQNLNIDYNNGVLLLSSPSVNQTLSINNVKSMRFTTSSAGINEVIGDFASGEIEFYNIGGALVGKFSSIENARKTLPAGIYIINNGEKSLKIIF